VEPPSRPRALSFLVLQDDRRGWRQSDKRKERGRKIEKRDETGWAFLNTLPYKEKETRRKRSQSERERERKRERERERERKDRQRRSDLLILQ